MESRECMTLADFVADARAVLSSSEGASQLEQHERQRDRAMLAALRFQRGHAGQLEQLLATLASEACNDQERTRWLKLADVAVAVARARAASS